MVSGESMDAVNEFRAGLEVLYGERLVKLVIYGSTARGEAGPHSDVDVVLVLKDLKSPSREIDRLSDLLASINIRHGVLVSVLPVDEAYYESASGPFWRNVHREGIAA